MHTHTLSLCTNHSHSITSQYGAHVQNCVIRHVGQDVDHRDDGHGDGDRQGQVPVTRTQVSSTKYNNQTNRQASKQANKRSLMVTGGGGRRSPFRVLDLLSDEVEGVPAGVGEEGRVQGQSDVPGVGGGTLEGRLKVGRVTW